ncbi:DUF1998 domain-containing protein [Demequina rhizosphaerae]|uniref:DUF1998 domain-containing protein n=1 Tax=Demequina rhizosphaerae TaxID=1638985 RepID=UPI0007857E42|nr:DUF1998 domain-containing protein [Demequina rhizosphaerae]
MSEQRKLRLSQTVAPFGVGAIVDIRGESFVGNDTWRWGNQGSVVNSPRLCRLLGVKALRSAPTIPSSVFGKSYKAIPYTRFPSWLFCSECRSMVRMFPKDEVEGQQAKCGACSSNSVLVPMRWIQICEQGHLDDINWRRYAHTGADDHEAKQCQTSKLKFLTEARKGAGGLDTLSVKCTACGAQRSLQGITSEAKLKSMGVRCTGKQPWQHPNDAVDCGAIPRAVQRGASNVYYAQTFSSIEIPQVSTAIGTDAVGLAIRNDPMYPALVSQGADTANPMIAMMVQHIANTHGVETAVVEALVREDLEESFAQGTVVTASDGDLRSEEWAALLTGQADDREAHFTIHTTKLVATDPSATGSAHSLLAGQVRKVVVADRLREVRALRGFHRVTPGGADTLVKVDLGKGLTWLPAVDAYGEGVFLALDEGTLAQWEERADVRERARVLNARIDDSFLRDRIREITGQVVQPRYILLHTLAHLLIQQLSYESGYASASMRERVYAKAPSASQSSQAGVLIYTAASDSEGTLGGLSRQGESPRLLETLSAALTGATWCSADPLCSERTATGFGSLSLAACHACAVIAETSCETGNHVLDRAMVIGSPQVKGFFQDATEALIAEQIKAAV